MTSDNIILFCGLFMLFSIGWYLGASVASKAAFNQVMKEHLESKLSFPSFIAEYDAGNYYLYNRDTKAFMVQGASIDELAEGLSTNKNINLALVTFPSTKLALENITAQVFWFVNGKAKEITVDLV